MLYACLHVCTFVPYRLANIDLLKSEVYVDHLFTSSGYSYSSFFGYSKLPINTALVEASPHPMTHCTSCMYVHVCLCVDLYTIWWSKMQSQGLSSV